MKMERETVKLDDLGVIPAEAGIQSNYKIKVMKHS
jgi:hypothetical protein